MVDSLIGNFRVVQKLGDGGMGAVYRAVDVELERDVALKFLRPELASEPDLVERFRAEAIVLARLSHPNIAALYGLHRHGDELFMAMEFVPGETMEALLARSGRVPPARAVALAGMVLDALDYAHRRGVVHRDIKLANLIVTPEGNVKVMDFGIARVLGTARKTRLGHVVGTIGYMAPEQIKGQEVDGRTDVYALGLVLYEMLTGRLPFEADTDWELMQAQVREPPPSPGTLVDLPPELEAAILTSLAKSPDDRFASAADFRQALFAAVEPERVADGAPTLARPAVAPTRLASAGEWASAPASGAVRPTRLATGPASEVPHVTPRVPPAAPASVKVTSTIGSAARLDEMLPRWRLYAAGVAVLVLVVSAAVIVPRLVSRPQQAAPAAPVPPADTAARTTPSTTVEMSEAVVLPPIQAGPSREAPRTRLPETVLPSPEPIPAKPPVARPAPGRPAASTPETAAPAVKVPSPEPTPESEKQEEPVPAPAVPEATEAAPSVTPPPVAPPAPTRAPLPVERFDKVKMLEQSGDKVREVDIVLELGADALTVRDRSGVGQPLKRVSYQSIASATFSQSKHPRWKEGVGAAVAFGVFAAPVFFMKGTKHWLTVQSADDFVVLRLDKNNYRLVLPALEARSGKQVEVVAGEK